PPGASTSCARTARRWRRIPRFPRVGRNYTRSTLGRFLPAVLVVALLGGSAAAFAVTERLKLVRSPIWRTQVGKVVSPGTGRRASIRFRLRSEIGRASCRERVLIGERTVA